MTRSQGTCLFWIVVGAVFLLIGIGRLTDDPYGCGSADFDAGSSCVDYQRFEDSPTTRTFEEQQDADRRAGILATIGGAVVLAGGVLGLVVTSRRPRENDGTDPAE